MKSILCVIISASFIFLSADAAAKFRVPRLKTVGPFKHSVISQTTPEFHEKRGRNYTLLRRFYVAQWGTQRYEYGYAVFYCDNRTRRCDSLVDNVTLKFFESCRKGFKKNGQPNCTGLVSARTDVADPLEEGHNPWKRTWYSCSDHPNPCEERNYFMDEYPNRYAPEDPEFNLPF